MDDPFEVLGIPRSAGEREIKKAYARLVKIHRPERDAEEFARVHDAFEAALGRLRGTPPVAFDVVAAPRVVPAPAMAPALSEQMPWRELRRHLDRTPGEVADALAARFRLLYQHNQQNQLWGEVCEPSLIDALLAHVELAEQVLPVIAAMAWYRPEVSFLQMRLRSMPRTPRLDRLADFVDAELLLAYRFFQLRNGGLLWARADGHAYGMPDSLVRLFGDRILPSPERRRQIRRDAVAVLDNPTWLLHLLDRLGGLDSGLAVSLLNRLGSEVPRPLLDRGARLPGDLGERLRQRVDAIARPRWTVTLRHSRLGRVTGAALGKIGNLRRYVEPTPPDYEERLRPALAAILAELGVPLAVLHERLASRPLESRYDRLVVELVDTDLGLTLLGAVATSIRTAIPS